MIVAVDGLLILTGVDSGDCGLGLLATPLASVEPAVEDACCVSKSSRGVGNCKAGRSGLLNVGQLVQRGWTTDEGANYRRLGPRAEDGRSKVQASDR
jgi:hypothetical protein